MSNYAKLARNARIKYIVFRILGLALMFATGFVTVATYIPFHIRAMIAVPAFLLAVASGIYTNIQELKYSEYSYKAKWG